MHRQRLEQPSTLSASGHHAGHSQHLLITPRILGTPSSQWTSPTPLIILDVVSIAPARRTSTSHRSGPRRRLLITPDVVSVAPTRRTSSSLHHARRTSMSYLPSRPRRRLPVTLDAVSVSSSLWTSSGCPRRSGRRQGLLESADTIVSITHTAHHRLLITLVVDVSSSLSAWMRSASSTRRTSTAASYRPDRSSKLCALPSCVHCPGCLLFADIFRLVSDGHCLQASRLRG